MSLEKKRKELELIRVRAARAELEFKVLELEEQITRVRGTIQGQLDKEVELETVLKEEEK